jgi:hypothetical protein
MEAKLEVLAYNWAQKCQKTALGFVQLFLRFCLEMESGLTGPLICAGLDLDLVFRHNLPHNIAESRRLAVFTSMRKIDRTQSERVHKNGDLLTSRFDTRTRCSTPN